MQHKTKIGIAGTGFIASGLFRMIERAEDFDVVSILTRRPKESITHLPGNLVTNSLEDFISSTDIILECSGDALHATDVILAAVTSQKKVVTVNAEFHVTSGSYFVKRGNYVTESDGDQPGCFARMKLELEGMGFNPMAYVNLKGFLNPNPTLEEMTYWSKKQQLHINQVVSFTDGTKLQIEQTLVGNGLGATIAQNGMIGSRVDSLYDLDHLVSTSEKIGQPISDYVLCKDSPPGILIVAQNPEADQLPGYLPFSKLRTTENRAYVLLRPFHLVYLETLNTLRKVVNGEPVLLNNSAAPTLTVAAVAKRNMQKGEIIKRGAGGFDVRGMAVKIRENRNAVPICLLKNTKVMRRIEEGRIVQFEDVEIHPSNALNCYLDGLDNSKIAADHHRKQA